MAYDSYENQAAMKRLFAAWQANPNYNISAFIQDGIVDPSKYSQPHVLFILRDMNCASPCDLCHELRTTGSGWKTWNNVARWAKALLTGCEEYPLDIDRVDFLKRVAVLNLKKEGGRARAVKAELESATAMHHKEILQEIQLCEPKIILCCGAGNANLLQKYVFRGNATEWKSDLNSKFFKKNWFYYYAKINGDDIPVVSFCHPQVTVLEKYRGHADLFEPLYKDMLNIKHFFGI